MILGIERFRLYKEGIPMRRWLNLVPAVRFLRKRVGGYMKRRGHVRLLHGIELWVQRIWLDWDHGWKLVVNLWLVLGFLVRQSRWWWKYKNRNNAGGDLGLTWLTFTPAAPMKNPSGDCEWYNAPWPTAILWHQKKWGSRWNEWANLGTYNGDRIVSEPGAKFPPERYLILAASLTIYF